MDKSEAGSKPRSFPLKNEQFGRIRIVSRTSIYGDLNASAQPLFIKWETDKSDKLRNEIIMHYLPWLKSRADKKLSMLPRNANVTLEDLLSCAVEGAMQSLRTFDRHRGIKFTTYATSRVFGQMADVLRSRDWVTRLARRRDTEFVRMDTHDFRPYSDDLDHGESPITPQHHDTPPMEADMFWRRACCGLSKQERLVLLMYYRCDCTMQTIADHVGLSESRISQIMTKILKRLKTVDFDESRPIVINDRTHTRQRKKNGRGPRMYPFADNQTPVTRTEPKEQQMTIVDANRQPIDLDNLLNTLQGVSAAQIKSVIEMKQQEINRLRLLLKMLDPDAYLEAEVVETTTKRVRSLSNGVPLKNQLQDVLEDGELAPAEIKRRLSNRNPKSLSAILSANPDFLRDRITGLWRLTDFGREALQRRRAITQTELAQQEDADDRGDV